MRAFVVKNNSETDYFVLNFNSRGISFSPPSQPTRPRIVTFA
jgi:hypothetical protein